MKFILQYKQYKVIGRYNYDRIIHNIENIYYKRSCVINKKLCDLTFAPELS